MSNGISRHPWRFGIWISILLALLLSGCGEAPYTEEVPPQSWGVAEQNTPDVTPEPLLTPETSFFLQDQQTPPEETPSPSETVEPDPTPAPVLAPPPQPVYGSLREVGDPGYPVLLDGNLLETVYAAGVLLLNQEEVTALLPWFQYSDGTLNPGFTNRNGSVSRLRCTRINGEDAPLDAYDGTTGIYFDGKQKEYWIPVNWLSGAMGFRQLWSDQEPLLYMGSPVDKSAIPQGRRVPVLMYHAVSDKLWGIESLFVSPSNMRDQLQWLKDNGYQPIWFSDLQDLDLYDKPVLLTFDDGYDDNYEYLFPLLQEFGMKATVFVITGMLEDTNYLTEEQVRLMSDSGLVDIQSHTVDHHELAALGYADQEYQLSRSRQELARITGKIPYVLSYPSGSRNGNTLTIAPQYYAFGVDMNGGIWQIQNDYYQVDRIFISRTDSVSSFASKVRG